MADEHRFPTLPLAGKNLVMLAVSGGSDSTALLHLAVRQSREMQNPPKLIAVTIDHKLRPESAREALSVKTACVRLEVEHQTLEWVGDKPVTGVQSAARHTRRTLLAQAAAKYRAELVLTGHTLDDQRETIVMRMKRGPGPGLAGIALASYAFSDSGVGEGIWFARPLLTVTRSALQGFLGAKGVSWIEDPSNDNEVYERVSVRKELASLPQQSLMALDQRQQAVAANRQIVAAVAAKLMDNFSVQTAPGLIRLMPDFFNATASEAMHIVLRTLLAFVAGNSGLAHEDAARKVSDTAARFFSQPDHKPINIGLGGALANIRKQGVYLMQEQRRGRPNRLAFGGRYRLLGAEHDSARLRLSRYDSSPAPASLIRKAKVSEPVFDCPDTGAMTSDEAWKAGKCLRLLLNPWPDLVPLFDFELAQSLAALCGAPTLEHPAI